MLLEQMLKKAMSTTMGKNFAPLYANLFAGFLKKTVLFSLELAKYFCHGNCKLIKELFKRYMDDGFFTWHSAMDLNVLKNVLNILHPTMKFTVEPVEIDIFYKETKTQGYLNCNNHQPSHIKCDIPFCKIHFCICFRQAENSFLTERATKMFVKLWLSTASY